jgi:hypothetical protein
MLTRKGREKLGGQDGDWPRNKLPRGVFLIVTKGSGLRV